MQPANDIQKLMSEESDPVAEKARRDGLLRAIGVNPRNIKWPEPLATGDEAASRSGDAPSELSDAEWQAIAPLLPPEAPQASAMRNRGFVNCVLVVMGRGGRWTDYPKRGPQFDAVRRRFGRWAHQGVWQRLPAELERLGWSAEHRALFANAARRAAMLCG